MKYKTRLILHIAYVILGAVLVVLGVAGILDGFWSGMGGALIGVGAIRLIQLYRIQKDETYREKVETEITDERNQFIRGKSWTWAGFLFVMISAGSSIVLKILGQELLSSVASFSVCLMVVLYWVSYIILKKKY